MSISIGIEKVYDRTYIIRDEYFIWIYQSFSLASGGNTSRGHFRGASCYTSPSLVKIFREAGDRRMCSLGMVSA